MSWTPAVLRRCVALAPLVVLLSYLFYGTIFTSQTRCAACFYRNINRMGAEIGAGSDAIRFSVTQLGSVTHRLSGSPSLTVSNIARGRSYVRKLCTSPTATLTTDVSNSKAGGSSAQLPLNSPSPTRNDGGTCGNGNRNKEEDLKEAWFSQPTTLLSGSPAAESLMTAAPPPMTTPPMPSVSRRTPSRSDMFSFLRRNRRAVTVLHNLHPENVSALADILNARPAALYSVSLRHAAAMDALEALLQLQMQRTRARVLPHHADSFPPQYPTHESLPKTLGPLSAVWNGTDTICEVRPTIHSEVPTANLLEWCGAMDSSSGPAQCIIGASSLTSAAQVVACHRIGCQFISTKQFIPAVVRAAHKLGLPVFCGAVSLQEIRAALALDSALSAAADSRAAIDARAAAAAEARAAHYSIASDEEHFTDSVGSSNDSIVNDEANIADLEEDGINAYGLPINSTSTSSDKSSSAQRSSMSGSLPGRSIRRAVADCQHGCSDGARSPWSPRGVVMIKVFPASSIPRKDLCRIVRLLRRELYSNSDALCEAAVPSASDAIHPTTTRSSPAVALGPPLHAQKEHIKTLDVDRHSSAELTASASASSASSSSRPWKPSCYSNTSYIDCISPSLGIIRPSIVTPPAPALPSLVSSAVPILISGGVQNEDIPSFMQAGASGVAIGLDVASLSTEQMQLMVRAADATLHANAMLDFVWP